MKNHLRIGFALSLLTFLGVMKADCSCEGTCSSSTTNGCDDEYGTILVPRPLDARLNWQNHYFSYQYDNDCIYGKFGVNYEYMRSMKGDRLAKYLFGTDKLSFLGSKATRTRTACDLLADNFGLATDLDASIRFEPRIQNHIFDFQLYVGLNELCNGLYFQINLPLVHSKWELNDDDCDCKCTSTSTTSTVKNINSTLSTTPFPAGYMSSDSAVTDIANLPVVTPNSTFFKALTGVALGDMTAWTNGKFFGHDDDTKLASVNFDLGYNFYECEDYHIGAFVRVSAPTGTDLDEEHAHFLFKPVIGEHHWKLGGGLDAHAQLYNCDDAHIIEMYLSGYAVHLFEREQVRSFDIKGAGRLSRYMLLKSFNDDGTYAGKLYNAIDFTTRRTNVEVSVEGEGVVGFTYKNECGFGAGLGYNIYGKSEEKICGLCNTCNTLATKKLGIKGTTSLQAQEYNAAALGGAITTLLNTVPANAPLLNSTQSNATAYNFGTVDNALSLGWNSNTVGTQVDAFLDRYNNPTIVLNTTLTSATTPVAVSSTSGPITNISNAGVITPTLTYSPVFLTDSNLDLGSAEVPSQITHRIFGHLDYEWDCDWTPALRLGGEVEFASESDKGAVNQWGVLLQGSVTF